MDAPTKTVYWHRELPPLDGDIAGEYELDATSARVKGSLAYRGDLWNQCYHDLIAQATTRLEQEVTRLGGHYAHVLNEHVDVRHDDALGEAWLRGQFSYVLYRRPAATDTPVQG